MTLKIAIVGTGSVACDSYIPYLAGQSDVSLGYYNRTIDTAHKVAETHGGVVFDSLGSVAAWNPDSALVLTSETARFEVGMQLIGLGLQRLFFEKPLVAALGQANVIEEDFANGKRMLDLASQMGCETAMVFNYRFFEQTVAAKRTVDDRSFGPLIHAVGQAHYACWSHCIDLVHHFGGGLAEITALAGNNERGKAGDGMVARDLAAAFRTIDGGMGTLVGTVGMAWQHPLYELILTFERGRVHLRDLDGTMEILDAARQTHESIAQVRNTSRWDNYKASFGQSLGAYLESLRNGQPPPVPGIDGLRELQVEAAMKRSIAQRRPIFVQDEFPLQCGTYL